MAGGTAVAFKFTLSDGTVVEKTFNVNDGLSAYELWQAAGNVGTLEDYLASNKGEKGDTGPEGPMGPMLEFVGVFNTVGELPVDVNVNSLATVGTFFYFFNGAEWVSLGDFAGPKGDKGDMANMTRAGQSGNWATNYSDNLAAPTAHGFRGGSEYWKTTISLDKAANGVYPPVEVHLQKIPCDENGAPLPYTLHHEYASGGVNKPVNLILVLWVHGTATQLLSMTGGGYSPLGTVDDIRYDPLYSMSYWY